MELKEGFEPKKARVISMTPNEKCKISEFIHENLTKGLICPFHSPQTSVVFIILKTDGGKRVIADYQL